jgi:hypothetical protein
MALTVDDVKNARKELELALKEVAKKTGIDFSVGRITYESTGLRCKIEGVVRGAAGTSKTAPADPYLVALIKHAKFYLPASFDQSKYYKDTRLGAVKIIGLNTRARSYPFIVQAKNGKKYKFASFGIRSMIEAGPVA